MKGKEIIGSKNKTGSMIALVEEYTDQLIESRKQPNPKKILDRYSNRAKREELKKHINIATLLSMQGLARQKASEKIMKNKKKIEKAKQKLLNFLLKNSGGGQ